MIPCQKEDEIKSINDKQIRIDTSVSNISEWIKNLDKKMNWIIGIFVTMLISIICALIALI